MRSNQSIPSFAWLSMRSGSVQDTSPRLVFPCGIFSEVEPPQDLGLPASYRPSWRAEGVFESQARRIGDSELLFFASLLHPRGASGRRIDGTWPLPATSNCGHRALRTSGSDTALSWWRTRCLDGKNAASRSELLGIVGPAALGRTQGRFIERTPETVKT
ncbi:hypothetical protein Poly41_47040 [Novipirellula artificiosorum]|uniref:Uncharacterized protein n=1 Tax=Novipirellula artificiosorum TaxID=2528016 RepID=A0A5C6DAG3_9BACT|nr:hypothetical protein Poly41_47040 [Novipirellula artificiosorum]